MKREILNLLVERMTELIKGEPSAYSEGAYDALMELYEEIRQMKECSCEALRASESDFYPKLERSYQERGKRMRKYNLEELANLTEASVMMMRIARDISENQAEDLGYKKDEIELMALRVSNFINEAEFTVTGGCV